MIQEVTVVCYGNYRSFVLLQVLFQPVNAFCIQVVGRLVEQQDVRFLQQQTAQSHTAAFTSRKVLHQLVFGRTAQRIHRTFQFAVKIPRIGSVNNILQFGLTRKECVHLFRIFIILRQTELLIDFFVFGQRVYYLLHSLHHDFLHGLRVVKLRFLCQITYRIAR